MFVAYAPQFPQELEGCDQISPFALDRLDEDGGYLLGRNLRLEQPVLDPARGFQCVLDRSHALRTAIEVRKGACSTPGISGAKRAPLLRLRGRQRQRAHGASVKSPVESDHRLPPGVIAGQLEGGFDRLPFPSCCNKTGADPAWEPTRTGARPASPCLRNKSRFPTCGSVQPPAAVWRQPLPGGSVRWR